MDTVTKLMFSQLVQAQDQIHGACADISPTCPVDQCYAPEWDGLRNYVDTAVGNIRAAIGIEGGDQGTKAYTPEQVRGMIVQVMHLLVPAANALLEGYLLDMATYERAEHDCPLHERAREALEARQKLAEGVEEA